MHDHGDKAAAGGTTVTGAGGKRTGGSGGGAGGRAAGAALKQDLRGKDFEGGADMLRPRAGAVTRTLTCDTPAAAAWGGYLRPSFSAAFTLTPAGDGAATEDADALLDRDIVPVLPASTKLAAAALVPSARAPLPGAAAIEAAVDQGMRRHHGKSHKGWSIGVGAVETRGWRLDPGSDTAWDKLEVNPTKAPNMDVTVHGGGRVALEVSGTGRLRAVTGADTPGRFDAEARAGLDTWLEIALRSGLYPTLSEGGALDDGAKKALFARLQGAFAGLLAPYGLELGGASFAVTQGGKDWRPPSEQLATTQRGIGAGKGSASFIAAADGDETAKEEAKVIGTETVTEQLELPPPTLLERLKSVFGYEREKEVTKEVDVTEKRGDFTHALLEVMKESPGLSITAAAERLIEEKSVTRQDPEVFKVAGDGDEADPNAVGKGTEADTRTKRALVVGCGDYRNVSDLPGATNDARNMAAALEGRGFVVTLHLDLAQGDLVAALRELVKASAAGEHVVIYFAGHGVDGSGAGVVTVDGKVLPHGQLGAVVAALQSRDIDCELVLDVCHAGRVTEMGEESFVAGAHGRDMSRLERQLFEIHMECRKARDHVFDYLMGTRRTVASTAEGSVRGHATYDNDAVVDEVLPRMVALDAQFLEATGKPLFAARALENLGAQRTLALMSALNGAHETSQKAWYQAVGAKRSEET